MDLPINYTAENIASNDIFRYYWSNTPMSDNAKFNNSGYTHYGMDGTTFPIMSKGTVDNIKNASTSTASRNGEFIRSVLTTFTNTVVYVAGPIWRINRGTNGHAWAYSGSTKDYDTLLISTEIGYDGRACTWNAVTYDPTYSCTDTNDGRVVTLDSAFKYTSFGSSGRETEIPNVNDAVNASKSWLGIVLSMSHYGNLGTEKSTHIGGGSDVGRNMPRWSKQNIFTHDIFPRYIVPELKKYLTIIYGLDYYKYFLRTFNKTESSCADAILHSLIDPYLIGLYKYWDANDSVNPAFSDFINEYLPTGAYFLRIPMLFFGAYKRGTGLPAPYADKGGLKVDSLTNVIYHYSCTENNDLLRYISPSNVTIVDILRNPANYKSRVNEIKSTFLKYIINNNRILHKYLSRDVLLEYTETLSRKGKLVAELYQLGMSNYLGSKSALSLYAES